MPWTSDGPPRRILAIRLQALGDIVITLPYLRALQQQLPNTTIDLVTRAEDRAIPRAVVLFRRVDAIGGGRSERRQLLLTPTLAPILAARRYDVVVDLQNNRVSRTLRRCAAPRAWATFDAVSPLSAGERTRLAIEAAGFPLRRVDAGLTLANPALGDELLRAAGWDPRRELIVLSPAGAFETRNWPIDRYALVAARLRAERGAQIAVVGLAFLRDKAAAIAAALGGGLIDVVGKTTAAEALAIVQRAALVIAEDCGLMHMAWVSGVPTVALFGSSRHDWSAPQGAHTICLHSGDLPCGACMEPTCRYGDVHCLTRYTADQVAAAASALLDRTTDGRGRVIYPASLHSMTITQLPSPSTTHNPPL